MAKKPIEAYLKTVGLSYQELTYPMLRLGGHALWYVSCELDFVGEAALSHFFSSAFFTDDPSPRYDGYCRVEVTGKLRLNLLGALSSQWHVGRLERLLVYKMETLGEPKPIGESLFLDTVSMFNYLVGIGAQALLFPVLPLYLLHRYLHWP